MRHNGIPSYYSPLWVCVRQATLLNELDTEKIPVFWIDREIKMLLFYELNLICSRSSDFSICSFRFCYFFGAIAMVTVRPVRAQVNVKERMLLLVLVIPVATTEIMSVNLLRDYYIGLMAAVTKSNFEVFVAFIKNGLLSAEKCDVTKLSECVQLTAGIFNLTGPNDERLKRTHGYWAHDRVPNQVLNNNNKIIISIGMHTKS